MSLLRRPAGAAGLMVTGSLPVNGKKTDPVNSLFGRVFAVGPHRSARTGKMA